MVHPWNGPRHNSWVSNTMLSGFALLIVFIATVVTDAFNGAEPPPTYLTGLLGVAAGSFFGAVGSDKGKKEEDTRKAAADAATDANLAKDRAAESSDTALRAQLKADILAELAIEQNPEIKDRIPPPLLPNHPLLQDPQEGGQT